MTNEKLKGESEVAEALEAYWYAKNDEIGSYAGVHRNTVGKIKQKIAKTNLIENSKIHRLEEFIIFVSTRYDGSEKAGGHYQKGIVMELGKSAISYNQLKRNSADRIFLARTQSRILFGADWDLMLIVYAKKFESVADFVVRCIRTSKYVVATHTSWSQRIGKKGGLAK